MEERTAARDKDASGGPSAPGGRYPPEAPAEGRPRNGETWGPAIALVPRPIDPTYLRWLRSAKGGDYLLFTVEPSDGWWASGRAAHVDLVSTGGSMMIGGTSAR